jgi:hypothetical protein
MMSDRKTANRKPPMAGRQPRVQVLTPLEFYALIGRVWADGFIDGVESAIARRGRRGRNERTTNETTA